MGDDKKIAGVGMTALFVAGLVNWITDASGLQTVGVFLVLFFVFWAVAEDKKDK